MRRERLGEAEICLRGRMGFKAGLSQALPPFIPQGEPPRPASDCVPGTMTPVSAQEQTTVQKHEQ